MERTRHPRRPHRPSDRALLALRSLALAAALAAAGVLVLPLVAGGRTGRAVVLTVVVRGDGAVVLGKLACTSRCAWRFPRGSRRRFETQPAMGNQFVRWRGLCSSRRSSCTIRFRKNGVLVGRFGPITSLTSWSPHTTCTPVRTTIPEIVGTAESGDHGATEAGGRFQPHLRGGAEQHLLNPPCDVGGTPAFVEVDDVVISSAPDRPSDGDDVANVTEADRPDIANPYLKTIHVEIDGTWINANVAPPLLPPLGTKIDVQGFVFWDPAHVNEASHSYSGWELHPLAAWRLVH